MGSINVSFAAEKYIREKANRDHSTITGAVDEIIKLLKEEKKDG